MYEGTQTSFFMAETVPTHQHDGKVWDRAVPWAAMSLNVGK